MEEVASDERLVTARKAIELEMDQFRSTVAAISRRQSALGRLPVNQRGQRDSDGIPVALKEYKKSKASVASANRQLIEGIHRALVDVGRPDLSFRWLQIALKETMPLVKRSGDWPKSVLEWASEQGGLEPAALEALAAECAAFESRRWALLKALSTATIDLFVAEQTGIAERENEVFVKAAAALWRCQAEHIQRVRSVLPEDQRAPLDAWMAVDVNDAGLMPCLDSAQLEKIATTGIGPPGLSVPRGAEAP